MAIDKYVLLLRSVNVGGRNPVPKAEFKRILEELGFRDVIIYLNSGNAVFASNNRPSAGDIQKTLEATFGFAIPCIVLPAQQIIDIAKKIPEHWTNDSPKPDKSGQKSDVIYLFPETDSPEIVKTIGHKPDIESMIYVKGAVLANVSRKNQSRSTIQKFIGTEIYKKVTIRNISTAKKLAKLAG